MCGELLADGAGAGGFAANDEQRGARPLDRFWRRVFPAFGKDPKRNLPNGREVVFAVQNLNGNMKVGSHSGPYHLGIEGVDGLSGQDDSRGARGGGGANQRAEITRIAQSIGNHHERGARGFFRIGEGEHRQNSGWGDGISQLRHKGGVDVMHQVRWYTL